jgi:tetratricopeptide (TPR) repeat protein
MTTLRFRPLNPLQPAARLALRSLISQASRLEKTGLRSPQISFTSRTVARSRRSVIPFQLECGDRDRLLRQQSLFCAQQGDFTTALSGLNLLLMRYPRSAADYNNRGLVYFQAGQWASALADYDKAIELDDQLANAYNNRANYYAAQNDLFAAVADYQTAIELDPRNIRAWINQGITFRELDMHIPALDNFEEALALNEEDFDSGSYGFLCAHIYAERGRANHLLGDWNCAMSDYYEAIAYLNEETQGHSYPPLWWQVDAWLGELLKMEMEVPEWGN